MRTEARTVPPAKDVGHLDDVADQRRSVQFDRRPESKICSIQFCPPAMRTAMRTATVKNCRRELVSRCQTVEGDRHIIEE